MRIVDALAPCFAIAWAAICLDAPLALAADPPRVAVDEPSWRERKLLRTSAKANR